MPSSCPFLSRGKSLTPAGLHFREQTRLENRPLGPLTGLTGVDAALGGFLSPGVHIVHGAPGVGKSAFALQVAAECGCPALIVTCEMTPLVLMKRLIAQVTQVPIAHLNNLPVPELSKRAEETIGACSSMAFLDATTGSLPIDDICKAASATRKLNFDSSHLLIVVDSVHSWADGNDDNHGSSEYDRLNGALRALQALSAQLICPMLVVAERNRAMMQTGGISAGAGSRKIEYAAETVISLNSKGESNRSTRTVNLGVEKNRHGEADKTFELVFAPGTQTFREVGK